MRVNGSEISDTGEEFLTEDELEIEPLTEAKSNKEEGYGKKHGRPLGAKNKRQFV